VTKRRFGQPCFLFFEVLEKESGMVRLHRHTVPGCIALKGLVRKFLGKSGGMENVPSGSTLAGDEMRGENDLEDDDDEEQDNIGGGRSQRDQDLHGFVRAVRGEYLCMTKRLEAISRVEELCIGKRTRAEGAVLRDVVCMDPAGRQVELVFSEPSEGDASGDMRARISVGRDGKIDGVVVRQVDGHGVGRRKRGVERLIMGSGTSSARGRIDDLGKRLLGTSS
jgi:hypothetical protein